MEAPVSPDLIGEELGERNSDQDLSGFSVPDAFDQDLIVDATADKDASSTISPFAMAAVPHATKKIQSNSGSESSTATVEIAEQYPYSAVAADAGFASQDFPSAVVTQQQRNDHGQDAYRKLRELTSSQRLGALRSYMTSAVSKSRRSSVSSISLEKVDCLETKESRSRLSHSTIVHGSPLSSSSAHSMPMSPKSADLRELEAQYEEAKAAPGRKDTALLRSLQAAISEQRMRDAQVALLEMNLDRASQEEDWATYESIANKLDTLMASAITAKKGSPSPPAAGGQRVQSSPHSLVRSPRASAARSARSKALMTQAKHHHLTVPRVPPSTSGAAPKRASPQVLSPQQGLHQGPSSKHFDDAAAAFDFVRLRALFALALEQKAPPATLAHGCQVVASLAAQPGGKRLAELGTANVCSAVVSTMTAFGNDAQVQEQGLEAIFYLGHSEDNQDQLGKENTCKLILQAMQAFSSRRKVQISAAKAMWILAAGHTANASALGSGGGSRLVCSAMRIFASDQQMQEWSCRVLINLMVGSPENTSACGAEGGCSAVVEGMRSFRRDRDVVYSGIRALLNLTCNDSTNRARCGAAGACRVVVCALKDFPKDRDMQLFSSVVVDNLSRDTENRSKLSLEGAVGAIVAAMRAFTEDRDIQFQGCRAIYFLTGGMCASEARAAVRSAMRHFPHDRGIMEEAADALGLSVQYTSAIANKGKR